MKKLLLAAASLASLATSAVASKAAAAPRVFLQSIPSRNKDNTPSGYVVAQRANGSFVRLSHSERCWNLKKSPDGKAWAWTEGETYQRRETQQTIFPAHIVVWRDGKSALISTEKIYDIAWRWNGSSQIAAVSCGAHGPPYWQLFDARTGRQIERILRPDAKLPAWAEALPLI